MGSLPQGSQTAGDRHIAVDRSIQGQGTAEQDHTAIDGGAFFDHGRTAKDQQVAIQAIATLQCIRLTEDDLAFKSTTGSTGRLQWQEKQGHQYQYSNKSQNSFHGF